MRHSECNEHRSSRKLAVLLGRSDKRRLIGSRRAHSSSRGSASGTRKEGEERKGAENPLPGMQLDKSPLSKREHRRSSHDEVIQDFGIDQRQRLLQRLRQNLIRARRFGQA